MKIVPTEKPADFRVSSEIWSSFAGAAKFCRISGLGGLARFVQDAKVTREGEALKASDIPGWNWFDERVFTMMRERAKAELRAQSRSLKPGVPLRAYVGLYMRLCLRQDLAVSKDWNEFDRYLVLSLRPQDSIVALVGRIAPQPAYSDKYAGRLPAGLKMIQLPGGDQQFIVDFNCSLNHSARPRVLGPFPF